MNSPRKLDKENIHKFCFNNEVYRSCVISYEFLYNISLNYWLFYLFSVKIFKLKRNRKY